MTDPVNERDLIDELDPMTASEWALVVCLLVFAVVVIAATVSLWIG